MPILHRHPIQTASPREAPNLNWLRVFVTAARAGSFAVAGEDLGVTAGAVSQRVKSLESQLGVALFRRRAQGVELTDAGRRLADRVEPLLGDILRATREVGPERDQRRLKISILPALAQLWLGPRVENWRRSRPDLGLDIDADATLIDLSREDVDLAMRYGQPPFDGYVHDQLLVDELVPVAAPGLAASTWRDAEGLPSGADLLVDTYWPQDFEIWRRQCAPASLANPPIQTFSLYSMVVDAAMKGQGFMIGHTALIGDHLRDGTLVALSDRRVLNPKQFHVLRRANERQDEVIDGFVTWLFAQASSRAKVDGRPETTVDRS